MPTSTGGLGVYPEGSGGFTVTFKDIAGHYPKVPNVALNAGIRADISQDTVTGNIFKCIMSELI